MGVDLPFNAFRKLFVVPAALLIQMGSKEMYQVLRPISWQMLLGNLKSGPVVVACQEMFEGIRQEETMHQVRS